MAKIKITTRRLTSSATNLNYNLCSDQFNTAVILTLHRAFNLGHTQLPMKPYNK